MAGWKRILGTKKELILTLFLAVLLAACAAPVQSSPTALATRRATYTPAPTATRTPYPATPTSPPILPLTSHEWQPEPVLLEFGFTCGDGCDGPSPARLTLFSTGELFVYDWSDDILDYTLQETKLSRSQVCQVLNTIDQNGFFLYDPSVYDDPPIQWANAGGPGGNYINVNAWLSHRVRHFAPWDFIFGDGLDQFLECEECGQPPSILSSFSDTFKLLYYFRPEDLRLSSFEDTAFFITEYPRQLAGLNLSEPWTEPSISIDEIFQSSACTHAAIFDLEGNDAIHLRAVIGRGGGVFSQNGTVYSVDYRRLLPGEFFPSCGSEDIYIGPDQSLQAPATLSCSPEDGVLPIPE